MQDFQIVVDLFKALGISSLFGPFFGLLLMFWFLRKSVLAGTGQFIRDFVKEYLEQQKEQVQISTEVDAKLGSLSADLKAFTQELKTREQRLEQDIHDVSSQIINLATKLGHPLKPSLDMSTETFRKQREKERNV